MELLHLQNLILQRCYKPENFDETIYASLHDFCDANSYGYGVALNLRQVVIVCLVYGKLRLSPLELSPLSRLELMACTLTAEVEYMLSNEIDMKQLTDSKYL